MVAYDLDTIMGPGRGAGETNASVFRATSLSTMNRFLKGPEFLPFYYGHLRGLIGTTFFSRATRSDARHDSGQLGSRDGY